MHSTMSISKKKMGIRVRETYYGSSGQYLNVDVKIAKGSKLSTVGNLAEGVGIRGIIQLAGGNGADLGHVYPQKDDNITPSCTRGYFGGNGGNGITGSYYNGPGTGGTGYCGGQGGNGYQQTYADGGKGGDGYTEGLGGNPGSWSTSGSWGHEEPHSGNVGSVGTKYQMTAISPINQIREGTVRYRTGGAFPSFATQPYNGTDARIRIELKQIDGSIGLNDGIISVEVNQSSSWEAMLQMGNAMDRIATAAEGGKFGGTTSGTPSTPVTQSDVVTVVKGKAFDIYVPVESNKAGATKLDTVTIINNDIKDGLIEIVGKIDTDGNKEIVVGDKKFVIQTVVEPDSTNIKAMLN